jgi:proline dehydrogenase
MTKRSPVSESEPIQKVTHLHPKKEAPHDERVVELLNELVTGKTKSDDPTIRFVVSRMRETGQELEMGKKALMEADKKAEELRNHVLQLSGKASGYAQDLLKLVSQQVEASTPPAGPTGG